SSLERSRHSGFIFSTSRNLPCATPTLQGAFPRTRFEHGCVFFIINEQYDAIGLGKPRHQFRLVPREPPNEVVGHPHVEYAAASICKDIDEVTLGHGCLTAERLTSLCPGRSAAASGRAQRDPE